MTVAGDETDSREDGAGLPGLLLQALRLTLAGRLLLALELRVPPGEIVTVMGPSGAGKSSLLAAISGTLEPAIAMSGRIVLDGREITALPPERRRVGMLFQDALLFPHLSVAGNLAIALPSGVTGRAVRRARVETALAEAELSGFGPRDPATLSGGQRARVALLRTLLAEPAAVLLDEPFSKLDVALRETIRQSTFAAIRRRGLPALLVTHDPEDAAAAAGPVVRLASAGG